MTPFTADDILFLLLVGIGALLFVCTVGVIAEVLVADKRDDQGGAL